MKIISIIHINKNANVTAPNPEFFKGCIAKVFEFAEDGAAFCYNDYAGQLAIVEKSDFKIIVNQDQLNELSKGMLDLRNGINKIEEIIKNDDKN